MVHHPHHTSHEEKANQHFFELISAERADRRVCLLAHADFSASGEALPVPVLYLRVSCNPVW
jgi:hypothetical protein